MYDLVSELVNTMAKQLEQRAQVPAADIWPCEKADITKTFDYSAAPLLDVLYKLFSQPMDVGELAQCFLHPSRLAYLAYLFTTKPTDEIDAKHRMFVAQKLVECISWLRNGNPFLNNNGDNNNIIFRSNNNGVIPEFDDLEFIDDISNQAERTVRLVFAALATLIEHTFFAWMGAGREYHGLYKYNNENLFVRDYYDLKVPHWNFSRNLPWKSLQFVSVESENAKVHFDFNGRGSLICGKMQKIALRIDGKAVRRNEFTNKVNEIFEILRSVLLEAIDESNKMTGEELLLQFVYSQYYVVQNACQNAGMPIEINVSSDVKEGILNSAGVDSGFHATRQKLSSTTDSELRYQLLVEYLNPGNLNKL